MLSIRKSITLNGSSRITVNNTEVTAVQLSANVAQEGSSNINTVIVNQEVYDANKETCRADIDAFTLAVRAIEDEEVMQ